jgi:hypothetical protein
MGSTAIANETAGGRAQMRTDPFAPDDAELDGNASQTLT